MTKVAILDRDGTLIDVFRDEESGLISTAFHPDHVHLLEGVVEGLRLLRDAGFVLAMATNQPGPAKKQLSEGAVRRTNDALVGMLADQGLTLARVEVCMHHPSVAACDCRKPKGGMLEAILAGLGADRASSWMLGDSRADLEAGRTARMQTGLVFRSDRCELCPLRGGPPGSPDVHGKTFDELARAVVLRAG